MYGMIHCTAREFAIERFGDAFWTEFSNRHGVEPCMTGLLKGLCGRFVAEAEMILYPDAPKAGPEAGAVFDIRCRAATAA